MSRITLPTFTEEDICILKQLDKEMLQNAIDFFRGYTKVTWHDDGPVYPREFMKIGSAFLKLAGDDRNAILWEEGFFSRDSIPSLAVGTFYSAQLICARIADAYRREHICEGLFGSGVENGLYLKMLLHLQDLHAYYEYMLHTDDEAKGEG